MKNNNFFVRLAQGFALCGLALLTLVVARPGVCVEPSRITIYVYPPSVPIDWSTPGKGALTYVESAVTEGFSEAIHGQATFKNDQGETLHFSAGYRSTMGHTITHIECRLPDGRRFDKWASLSGDDFVSLDIANIHQNYGAGALFYDYIDGKIIAGEMNQLMLAFYRGRARDGVVPSPRYLSAGVDSQACQRVFDLEQEFESYYYPQTVLDPVTGRSRPIQIRDLEARQAGKWESRNLYFTTNLDPLDSYRDHQLSRDAPEGGWVCAVWSSAPEAGRSIRGCIGGARFEAQAGLAA